MPKKNRWRDETGYQLLEVTLVCALTTLILTFGWLNWQSLRDHYFLNSGRLQFLAAASQARQLAVVKGFAVQIGVNSDRMGFALAIPKEEPTFWRKLPQGVRFDSIPARPLIFYSRGGAAPAGTFLLGNRSGQIRVVVAPSGRIRWERVR